MNWRIWQFKKFIWSLFHWPKYKVGDRLTHTYSGEVITIKSRYISPYLPSSSCSWSYIYGNGFSIGEAGLEITYNKEQL